MGLGYGSHTWPLAFMPEVKKRLTAIVPGMTADRVFQSVWSDEDHLKFPVADRFVALTPTQFPVDQRDVDGGGSVNTAFDMVLVTRLFVRVEADLEDKSGAYMDDQVYGVYRLARDVIKTLQTWDGPVNPADGLSMFRRPMRVDRGWDVRPKSGRQNSRWGLTSVTWQLSFVADLDDPYPS